ncbi:M23 family metallopeptidase [Gordonia sp. CPCC 206044]|uniref:M23 family metallopeptidase n=1 Tax=Gordonia sp. CPCC 206044 TaxID=3140793 RepID=UPI003AF3EABC
MTHRAPARIVWRHALGRALVVVAEPALVVALLWALPAVAFGVSPQFRAPLDTMTVTRPYDPPQMRWQSGHRGVDLSAPPGRTVRAAGAGTVAFAGSVAGREVVSVRHVGDLITTYEPVRASVRRGEHVDRGDLLGIVAAGHPGCPAAACLHWGARRGRGHDATYLNPMALLGAVRVRLKPVDP